MTYIQSMPDGENMTWLDYKDLSLTMCLQMQWKILASHKKIQEMLFFDKVLIDYKEEFSVYTKYATDIVNKFVNKFLLSNLSNVDL